MTRSLPTSGCPQCGAAIDADPRFSAWCLACEWNLGDGPSAGGPPQRRRERAERLYARLARGADGAGRGAQWWGAVLVAALVHLWTLAVAVGSGWLLLSGNGLYLVAGLAGLGLTFLLRPRFGRRRADDPAVVSREQAPQLYALADRVADVLGVRRADRIRVEPGYLTSYARVGVRQEVELTVGLALWTGLTPQQRIALLGHELAHGGNADPRRGLWLRLALDTLDAWYGLLMPSHGDALMAGQTGRAGTYEVLTAGGIRTQMAGASQKRLLDGLTTRALYFCALPVRLARRVLHRLVLPGSQRAEYRADEMAARVGSSAAAAGMLDALFLEESAAAHLRQQRATVGHGGIARPADLGDALWSGLEAYLDTVPDLERERRRRLAARRSAAVDGWHPPTHLRLRLRAERPEQPAAVRAGEADWPAIHAELEDSRWRTAILVLGI